MIHIAKRSKETGYIKYLTESEFVKIRNYIEKKFKSPSMKMCLKFLIYTGIRVGDVVEMKRFNFNKDFSVVTYTEKKTKKTHSRIMPEKLRKQLAKFYMNWHQRCRDNYLFFPSYKNNSKNLHLKTSSIRIRVKQITQALQICDVYHKKIDGKLLYRITPHTFRHFAVWRYYKAYGKCIKSTQQEFNHVKFETTAKYIRVMLDKKMRETAANKAYNF